MVHNIVDYNAIVSKQTVNTFENEQGYTQELLCELNVKTTFINLTNPKGRSSEELYPEVDLKCWYVRISFPLVDRHMKLVPMSLSKWGPDTY